MKRNRFVDLRKAWPLALVLAVGLAGAQTNAEPWDRSLHLIPGKPPQWTPVPISGQGAGRTIGGTYRQESHPDDLSRFLRDLRQELNGASTSQEMDSPTLSEVTTLESDLYESAVGALETGLFASGSVQASSPEVVPPASPPAVPSLPEKPATPPILTQTASSSSVLSPLSAPLSLLSPLFTVPASSSGLVRPPTPNPGGTP